MRVDELYKRIKLLVISLYSDIVVSVESRSDRLRIYFVDNSFLDVWFSRCVHGKYAFHWERRYVDGTVYRWDNTPHRKYRYLETYPHHFHKGSRDNVKPFKPGSSWEETVVKIFSFIREVFREYGSSCKSA